MGKEEDITSEIPSGRHKGPWISFSSSDFTTPSSRDLLLHRLSDNLVATLRLLSTHCRWNVVQLRWSSMGKCSNKQFMIHVIKRGETLTAISRQYGVSIQAITAVNASIVDIDFVLEGEQLKIPFIATGMDSTRFNSRTPDRCRSFSNIQGARESPKLAKPSGYFLVLVPFVAICIRCMINAFQQRVARNIKLHDINKSHAPQHASRSSRWRMVLSDHTAPDTLDASAEISNDPCKEDQSVAPFEEMSQTYSKLEPAYLKFLSECGMSKWGYWRGGSPE